MDRPTFPELMQLRVVTSQREELRTMSLPDRNAGYPSIPTGDSKVTGD